MHSPEFEPGALGIFSTAGYPTLCDGVVPERAGGHELAQDLAIGTLVAAALQQIPLYCARGSSAGFT